MSRFFKSFQFVLALLTLAACQEDTISSDIYTNTDTASELRTEIEAAMGSMDELVLPDSDAFTNIPSDPQNPLNAQKVELGKFLFHETGIARNAKLDVGMGTFSCASCHNPKAGFQSGAKQGMADGALGFGIAGEARIPNPLYEPDSIDAQPIRAPTILNVAFLEAVLWNGQLGGTGINLGTESSWTDDSPSVVNRLGLMGPESQALAGIQLVHRLKVDEEFVNGTPYKEMFDNSFPEIEASRRYNDTIAGFAIAAYVRTVMANKSPFQRFLKGEPNAMREEEMRGAKLFFGKAKCMNCHTGPALNGGTTFHALGMKDFDPNEVVGIFDENVKRGRGGFTGNPEDDFKFKTPTLYNLRDVNFLGHGSSFSNVREVIEYKNRAIPENIEVPLSSLSPEFQPLRLTESEIDDLTAFVENALHDPDLERFVPATTPLQNCFPNADDISKADLGCE